MICFRNILCNIYMTFVQVIRRNDAQHGSLSSQKLHTVDAIVEARKFPLSIILVGVGDGPWDMVKEFQDNIKMQTRTFHNFKVDNVRSTDPSSIRCVAVSDTCQCSHLYDTHMTRVGLPQTGILIYLFLYRHFLGRCLTLV
ncbi:putative copine [Medicago truncatula]|uniref:Putative copine n=1 Tax=Medicago truncatula TaxID=3880 RepID=A0A396H3W5_MEDTR|nr:putative copine [Medicago truncatula]